MKKEKTINIILPAGASTSIDFGLVEITRQLRLKTGKNGGFGLGGKDGYGIDYENETFMMHPYCECDKDDCKWCNGDKPNFLYKPSNCEITWCKYIGRSQKQKGKLPKDWLQKCIESIWEKDDCYYEFDIEPTNLEEGLMGRKNPPRVILNFNVSDKNALIEAELSLFAEDNVQFWGLSEIISDIANAKMEECEEYKKAIELDKKYPKLREKIKQDAINRHKERIKWHKKFVKRLTSS